MSGILIRIQIPENRQRELHQALEGMWAERDQDLPGRDCRVFRSWDASDELLILEIWENPEKLGAHLNSEGFAPLLGAIRVLGSLRSMKVFDERSEKAV